jgi:hypothetical protein
MRVGLVDCGLPLCRTTWTHAQFSWEIDPRVRSRATTLPECPSPTVSYESVAKSPVKLLESNAVDLLLVDHSRHDRAASFFNRERRGERVWTDWLAHSTPARIVEIWREQDVPTVVGLSGKSHRRKIASHGYVSQHQIVRATEVGGSVKHARMVVIHTKLGLAQACRDMSGGWDPNLTLRLPRPMSNLLRPAGLVPQASWSTTRSIADLPVRERDPMPAHAGTWISDGGRARRLLTEELAKGLGVPKSWGNLELLDPRPLGWQTCSHIYEWLGNVLATADAYTEEPATAPADDSTTASPDDHATAAADDSTPASTDGALPRTSISSDTPVPDPTPSDPLPAWTWEAPDLRPGSQWNIDRVTNLANACKGIPGRAKVISAMSRSSNATSALRF